MLFVRVVEYSTQKVDGTPDLVGVGISSYNDFSRQVFGKQLNQKKTKACVCRVLGINLDTCFHVLLDLQRAKIWACWIPMLMWPSFPSLVEAK
jgi:hypothetical protein